MHYWVPSNTGRFIGSPAVCAPAGSADVRPDAFDLVRPPGRCGGHVSGTSGSGRPCRPRTRRSRAAARLGARAPRLEGFDEAVIDRGADELPAELRLIAFGRTRDAVRREVPEDEALEEEANRVGDLGRLVLAYDRERLQGHRAPLAGEDARRSTHGDSHVCTGRDEMARDVDPCVPGPNDECVARPTGTQLQPASSMSRGSVAAALAGSDSFCQDRRPWRSTGGTAGSSSKLGKGKGG